LTDIFDPTLPLIGIAARAAEPAIKPLMAAAARITFVDFIEIS